MKKEIPQTNASEIKRIPDSQYILLPNGIVARLLKPTTKSDKKLYFLRIKGELKQISVDDIEKMIK
jgi:hypothetical protein